MALPIQADPEDKADTIKAARDLTSSFARSLVPYNWESPPRFKYGERLAYPDAFRLARVEPGFRHQDIECTLLERSLTERLRYAAVSYAWGDQSQRKFILCNGMRFAVTADLHAALCRLRRTDKPVLLWIDQICIDQENYDEKGQQVQRMIDIYGNAEVVIIWLGEVKDNSDKGMKLGSKILDAENGTLKERARKRKGFPSWSHPDWEALRQIFLRPWFRRVWVIQEAALASRAVVVCGKETFSWSQLLTLTELLAEKFSTLVFQGDPVLNGNALRRLRDIADLSARKPRPLSQGRLRLRPIMDLLIEHRECGATKPMDKVYALLGLSDSELTVDYNISAEEVYLKIARAHICAITKDANDARKSQGFIRMLYCAGAANRVHSVPSWVPDWGATRYTNPFYARLAWIRDATPRIVWKEEDLPSDRMLALLEVDSDNRLALKGRLCDHIEMAGSARLDAGHQLGSQAQQVALHDWFLESDRLGAQLNRDVYAFGRAVTANRFWPSSENPWKRIEKHVSPKWDSALLRFLVAPGFKQSLNFPLPTAEDYVRAIDNAYGRVFVVTRGRYMGLAPHGTQAGDVVCRFPGGAVPFILRASGDEYVLIGECFVNAYYLCHEHAKHYNISYFTEDEELLRQIPLETVRLI